MFDLLHNLSYILWSLFNLHSGDLCETRVPASFGYDEEQGDHKSRERIITRRKKDKWTRIIIGNSYNKEKFQTVGQACPNLVATVFTPTELKLVN